jgi:RNA polymerase sigma-70 factor (ECF subfamily)
MRPVPADPSAFDSETLARLRRGDAGALTAVYTAFGGELLALARRLTGSDADAEDILHDLMVGLPERMRNYDEQGKLRGWLKQIVVNMSLMRLRSDRRRNETDLDTAILPPAPALVSDRSDAIEIALRELSAPIRAVVVLRLVEGFSHREIGEALGISSNASEARLSRGVAAMRRRLETLI